MNYNGKPLYITINELISEYTKIPETEFDCETDLESIGIPNQEVRQFTFFIAGKFGFDDIIDGDEIGEYAAVWNVTEFVECNL